MRRRRVLALIALLLPAAALSGCGDGENTNSVNTSVNTNAVVNTNVNAGATPAPLSPIDEIKSKMALGNIVFNPPDSVKLDASQTIILMLSPKQTPGELEQQLREKGGTGKVEWQSIRISDKMRAVISGDGFQITPLTPETMPVSKMESTEWSWEVRPLRTGTLNLHVVLSAIVDLSDGSGERPYPIQTFHKVYFVEVPQERAARPRWWTGRVWSWLLPALLVPAGGVTAWLWLRRRKRRRSSLWFEPGTGEPRIFLSYRREDTAGHVGRLRDSLSEHFGAGRVFMDLESIRIGDDFVETLGKAVDSSGVVVVVIGRQWLSATSKKGQRRLDNPQDFVRLEVETALRRGVKVIPALVQGAEMPGEEALPVALAKLARRNAIEISDSRWTFDVERLIEAIEAALSSEPEPPATPGALPG